MIKTVIFDFDNTLYEYEPCHIKGLETALTYLITITSFTMNQLKEGYTVAQKEVKKHTTKQAASHSRLLYFKNMCENLNLDRYELPIYLEELYWNSYLETMVLFPKVLELLKFLKSNTIKIGMCTDLTTRIQLQKVNKVKLQDYFDVIVTSEEAGVEKPDPYIFDLTLKRLHSNVNETLFIGDSLEKDIVGSISCGMKAIYLSKKPIKGYTCAKDIEEAYLIIRKGINS